MIHRDENGLAILPATVVPQDAERVALLARGCPLCGHVHVHVVPGTAADFPAGKRLVFDSKCARRVHRPYPGGEPKYCLRVVSA